jgi:hypothetical protein
MRIASSVYWQGGVVKAIWFIVEPFRRRPAGGFWQPQGLIGSAFAQAK